MLRSEGRADVELAVPDLKQTRASGASAQKILKILLSANKAIVACYPKLKAEKKLRDNVINKSWEINSDGTVKTVGTYRRYRSRHTAKSDCLDQVIKSLTFPIDQIQPVSQAQKRRRRYRTISVYRFPFKFESK